MKIFWETKYKPIQGTIISSTTQPPSAPPTKAPNDFLEWLKDDDDDDPTADEYARYILQPQVPGIKQGYKWWLEPRQQKNFLNLCKMALDILSIPAMSADPERLFSGAKITISDRRNRLGIYTIEALECLKSWLKISTFLDDEEDNRDVNDDIRGDPGQIGAIEILE